MSDDAYEVGYGKPPKASQFKKGQSGNPMGRPKGARNFSTDVKEVLTKPVSVNEGNAQRTISTQMATLMRLREKALKGDAKAIDRLLALAQAHMSDPAQAGSDEPRAEADQALCKPPETAN
ncbi:MAG: DUF5681 domain-containing protein [Pseudomonadota bacterium]